MSSVNQLLKNYSYMLIKEHGKLESVTDSTKQLGTIEFYTDELKRIEQALKEKDTCICMNCGKIIKTVEQSKHSKNCERAELAMKAEREFNYEGKGDGT